MTGGGRRCLAQRCRLGGPQQVLQDGRRSRPAPHRCSSPLLPAPPHACGVQVGPDVPLPCGGGYTYFRKTAATPAYCTTK